MNEPPADRGSALADQESELAGKIIREAATRYIAERRARVRPFVDRHFGLRGSLRLHRAAVGPDIVRAPVNLVLALPNIAAQLGGAWARRRRARVPRWLDGRDIFLRTDVDREIEWLVHTDLLELPFRQGPRGSDRDALADTVLAHEEVQRALADAAEIIGSPARDPELAARLEENLRRYTGSRAAATDMAAALTSMGAGGLIFHQLTPSALSLGPALAALVAHHAAVVGFPLGAGLGGMWYGMFPAAPSAALVASVTGGLFAGIATASAFAGIITDPVQRALGIHQRRLDKLIDVLEADLLGDSEGRFTVRAHYVARLVDFFECIRAAYRVLR